MKYANILRIRTKYNNKQEVFTPLKYSSVNTFAFIAGFDPLPAQNTKKSYKKFPTRMLLHQQFERMKRWIAVSFKMDVVLPGGSVPKPLLLPRIQRLGELDCRLVDQEAHVHVLSIAKPEDLGLFSERLYLSHLWTLDAYEILRILKGRDKKFQPIYQSIRIIRVPLAKHEKAGVDEYGFRTYPIIDPQTGRVGWMTDGEQHNFLIGSQVVLKEQVFYGETGKSERATTSWTVR